MITRLLPVLPVLALMFGLTLRPDAAVVGLPESDFEWNREKMVQTQIADRNVSNPAVLTALRKMPRHRFVPTEYQGQAYADRPLPIGFGQTISQPYIVAYMTEVLELSGTEKVLEIGTGSGYQAAILAETAGEVFSMEIIPQLYERSRKILDELGYGRAKLRVGDGYQGLEEHAPFDRIIVTCAAGHIPPPLLRQLKPGGRMVIPVGQPWSAQSLVLAEKSLDGQVLTRNLMSVSFVPLVRGKE